MAGKIYFSRVLLKISGALWEKVCTRAELVPMIDLYYSYKSKNNQTPVT